MKRQPVILIGLDGFRADYLSRNVTPTIERLRRCGVHTPYMKSATPSKTFPNLYTIVTVNFILLNFILHVSHFLHEIIILWFNTFFVFLINQYSIIFSVTSMTYIYSFMYTFAVGTGIYTSFISVIKVSRS